MIAAVVLAAGASARFGAPKALVRYDGRTLLQRVVDAALHGGCEPVIVVLGAQADTVARSLGPRPVEPKIHSGWSAGLASSIAFGVSAAAQRSEVDAALLLCCDQPMISAALVRRVLAAFDGSPGRMVACAYAGTLGIPALFERRCFPALRALRGDRGAKSLLLGGGPDVVPVDWPEGALDIDRPRDLTGRDGAG